VFLFVVRDQDFNDVFKQLIPVGAPATWAFVERHVCAQLRLFALNAVGHDLAANLLVVQHAVAVDMHKHQALTTLQHLLAVDDHQANLHLRQLLGQCFLWREQAFVFKRRTGLLIVFLARLESLADWTEESFFSQFVALGAQSEVFGPLVVSLSARCRRIAVLALDAVFAAEPTHLQVQLLDITSKLVVVFGCGVKRPQRAFVLERETVVVRGRVALLARHQLLVTLLTLAVRAALAVWTPPVQFSTRNVALERLQALLVVLASAAGARQHFEAKEQMLLANWLFSACV